MPTKREIKQRQAVAERLVKLGLSVRVTHDPKKNLEQVSPRRKRLEEKILEATGHPVEPPKKPLSETEKSKILKKEIDELKKVVAKPSDWLKTWGAWPKKFG